MGWEPITYCPNCGEAHDVYAAPGERLCGCCLEILAIDAAQARDRYEDALREKTNERTRQD